MPGKGEEALGFHLLHDHFHCVLLVAGIGDPAPRGLTGNEGRFQVYLEPLREFTVVRQGAPDSRDRGLEFDLFFDSILFNRQRHGCMLKWSRRYATIKLHLFLRRWMSVTVEGCAGHAVNAKHSCVVVSFRPKRRIPSQGHGTWFILWQAYEWFPKVSSCDGRDHHLFAAPDGGDRLSYRAGTGLFLRLLGSGFADGLVVLAELDDRDVVHERHHRVYRG